MKTHGGATAASDHSKPKSREVISPKFLSPNSSTASASSSSTEYGIQSPNSILSPIKQKPRSSIDSKKHKSLESSGFFRGLWPSSSTLSPSTVLSKPDTLADHLGNERLKDMSENKHNQNQEFLGRQRSCTGLSRFENGKRSAAKENHRPIFGRSMGNITGKFKFHGKSLKSSDLLDDKKEGHVEPGRFSVDGIALSNKSFGRGVASDSESEHSDLCSGGSFETQATGKKLQASYMAPTMSSRKHGAEDSPHDLSMSRSRRWSADSSTCNPKPFSPDTNSPRIFTLKNSMKKASSKWALSAGRSGSPTADNIPSPKPPTSPSREKGGVGNILTMGIELLKGKRSSSSAALSPLGPGAAAEIAHELRLLHNRLVQWRYANARAEAVNGNVIKYAERDFLYAWNSIVKLQHSVVQKKLQLQSERLEIKLNYILTSHMKELERWGNMERQHLSAVTSTKDYLHGVVCRIPLVDGAKGEKPSVSFAVRHANDVAAAIDLKLTTCSPVMEKTAGLLVELAMVVTQEKLLLEECLELFRMISSLEMQERSLKSSIMQSGLMQYQHHILST